MKQCSEHLLDNVPLFKHQQCRTHPHICFRNLALIDLTSSLHSPVEPLDTALRCPFGSEGARYGATLPRRAVTMRHDSWWPRTPEFTNSSSARKESQQSCLENTIGVSARSPRCWVQILPRDINRTIEIGSRPRGHRLPWAVYILQNQQRSYTTFNIPVQIWNSRRPRNWPSFSPLSCCRF